MFTANVSNANNGQPEMMVVVELAVTASADVERVSAIVKEAMMTSKYVYVDDDHPFVVLIEDESYYRTIRGKGVCGRRARRVRIRLRRDRALDGRLRQRRGRNARGARSRLRTPLSLRVACRLRPTEARSLEDLFWNLSLSVDGIDSLGQPFLYERARQDLASERSVSQSRP